MFRVFRVPWFSGSRNIRFSTPCIMGFAAHSTLMRDMVVMVQVLMTAKPGASAGLNSTFPPHAGYLQYLGLNSIVLDNICVYFDSASLAGSQAVAASLEPPATSSGGLPAATVGALAALGTVAALCLSNIL